MLLMPLSFAIVDMQENLILAYTFSDYDGSDVYDVLGQHNATIRGSSSITSSGCINGDCYSSTGNIGDWIEINRSLITALGYDNVSSFTWSMWIKPDSIGDDGLFSIGGGAGTNRYLENSIYSDTIYSIIPYNFYSAHLPSAVYANSWTQIAVVYNHSTFNLSIYVNGTSLTASDLGDYEVDLSTSGLLVMFGVYANLASQLYFDGLMDEFYIWGEAFSKEKLDLLYGQGVYNFYPFSDADPPVITIDSPSNNSLVNTDVFINVSLNENGECELNNTDFYLYDSTSTNFSFYETGLPNSNYNILISCNDTYGNMAYSFLNFTKASPSLEILSPLNNSFIDSAQIDYIFQFNYFEPVICVGYSNITGSYEAFDNITTSPINETDIINTTVINSALIGYYRGESVFGNIAYDSSYLEYDGLAYSVTNVSTKGGNGTLVGAYFFNNVSSVINLTDRDVYSFTDGSDKPFSVSFWMYPYQTGTGNVILSKRDDYYASNKEYDVQITGGGYARLNVNLWDADNDRIGRRYDSPLSPSVWYHVAITYSGNESSNGIKIYLNKARVDNYDSSSGSYDGMVNRDVPVLIGAYISNTKALGGLFYGKLDEISLFNKTLSQSEINDIYDNGVWIINSTISYNITTINQSLNQSVNYTFTLEPSLDTKESIDTYVMCEDTESINSSHVQIRYDNDFTAPTINILFPNETNASWNLDMFINFTTSEYATCEFSEPLFSQYYSNGSVFSYSETLLDNGYYEVNLSCTDTSFHNNTANETIYFTKDKEYPFIFLLSPANNQTLSNPLITEFILNLTDNIDLYSFHYNITYDKLYVGEVMLYEETINLSGAGKQYIYSRILNTANFSNKTIYLSAQLCDSHTNDKIKEAKKITNTKDSIKFELEEAEIEIQEEEKKSKATKVNKEYDRYTFSFDFMEKDSIKKFKLKTKQRLEYLSYSRYKGHFVLYTKEGKPKYWLDFENDGEVDVSYKCKAEEGETEEECYYLVEVESDKTSLEFSSIGELNCNSKQYTFTYGIIEPFALFGFHLDFNKISHVLLIFTFIILYLGMMALGYIFKNFGFASFGFILGIVLGLLLIQIHIYMFFLFTLLNIAVFIRYAAYMK